MISLLVSDFRKISVSVPSIPVAVLGLSYIHCSLNMNMKIRTDCNFMKLFYAFANNSALYLNF